MKLTHVRTTALGHECRPIVFCARCGRHAVLGGSMATVEADASAVRMFRADHAACTWPELADDPTVDADLADLDAFLERVEGAAERVIH